MIFFQISNESQIIYFQIRPVQKVVKKKQKQKQQPQNAKLKINCTKKKNYMKKAFKIHYCIIK